jgi:hypothetical protein
MTRGPSLLSGSVSGSATPSTSYGSFPPTDGPARDVTADVENILRTKLSQEAMRKGGRMGERRWERSRERLLLPGKDGRQSEDVYDSDGEAGSDGEPLKGSRTAAEEEEDAVWTAGDSIRGRERVRESTRSRAPTEVGEEGGDKQWGVVKMELMARTWGKRGLFTIYAGCASFPPSLLPPFAESY